MAEQFYFEDVEEGMDIPTLRKDPTTQQLVKYAGASGDYYQIHYDLGYARNNALPDVILHGALKNAFLGQVMTDFAGEWGTLKKLSVQYRGMDIPGTPDTRQGRRQEEVPAGRREHRRVRDLARGPQRPAHDPRLRRRGPARARRVSASTLRRPALLPRPRQWRGTL